MVQRSSRRRPILLAVLAALVAHAATTTRITAQPPTVRLLADITPNPGPADSSLSAAAVYKGELYFGADDGVHGRELWRATAAGASLAADIVPGPGGSRPGTRGEFAVVGDVLYFVALHPSYGLELWRYDGTTATLAIDFTPGPSHSFDRRNACHALEGAVEGR